ncbi:MAG: oxidoreductase [Ramlibacter sp.]|nr:oxidoreductase [Ramlibacter sp.]
MTQEPILRLKLRQVRLEVDDICSFEFVAANGGVLPPFAAGAHIDLHLPEGRVRSYSLANAPVDSGQRYLIAVQREAEGRGGSAWMHDSLRVGQVLDASIPSNDFELQDGAADSIFIAGGIGITPILSMIEQLESERRAWRLFYAARSPEAAAFCERLRDLDRGRGLVTFCFASERAERLDISAIVKAAGPATHLYCCGPARMIDAFVDAGQANPLSTIHYERFAAGDTPALEGGFTVHLTRTDRRIPVEPGKTILDALLDADVAVSYACSNGICGSCMTRVVSGIPDHRDDFLSEDEKRAGTSMLICCSGSKTPELVLDI